MTVVAEGIETEEQVRALISCGVEQGQGYLVAAPLPFARFMALLDARRRETESDDATAEAPLIA
ncbi:EAL domain-containing protein [Bradyrhizobium sp. UFLA05-112]